MVEVAMVEVDYRNQIVEILQTVDVKKVYYIDDALEINELPSIGDVVAALLALPPESPKEAIQELLPNIPLIGGEELVRSAVTRFLDDPEQSVALQKLGELLAIETPVRPNLQVTFLEAVFNGMIPLECMGPTSWSTMESKVMTEAQSDSRVLCLFDEVLDPEHTSTNPAFASGMNIIRRIAKTDNKESILCVLFTNELKMETEVGFWRDQIANTDIVSSKFFPLSKSRTKNSKHFAEGMQVSSLNLLYDILKIRTVAILDKASEETKFAVDKIHVYNLNYMVAATSHSEGVWEARTLMRLYDIIQSEKTKSRIVIDNYASYFNKNIGKVKAINAVLELPLISSDERYALRHQELYERPEWLNKAHTELSTGDIFRIKQIGSTPIDFVVLAQLCDISLRNRDGERRAAIITIAPIKLVPKAKYETDYKLKRQLYLETAFILHHYRDETDDVGCVELNNAIAIEGSILDLAVFNKQGQCAIDISQQITAPEELPYAWKLRFAIVQKEFEVLRDRMRRLQLIHDNLDADSPDRLLINSVMYSPYTKISKSGVLPIVKTDYSTDVIDWGIERVGNIRPPVVNNLLEAYTQYLSRVAHDHNFSSLPKK